jgi:hypothetical protein
MTRLAAWLLLGVPYAWLVSRFRFTTDDAYISFRYARNLTEGHGLRFNLAENPPVEGYSNFLWVLLCAALHRLGLDLTVVPLLLSAACGFALLWLVLDRAVRRFALPLPAAALGALTLAVFPPFAVWATSGLDTMPFALCVFLAFDRLILADRPGWSAGAAMLALALMRFEGAAWAAALFAMALVSRRRNPRALALPAVIFAIGYGAYTGWRLTYHEELLPNTARIKTGSRFVLQGWLRGTRYVATHFLTFLTPFLLVPATWLALRRRSFAWAGTAALAWAFPAYAVAVGGDFMAMGRFLVPGFAFQALLTAGILAALPGGLPARVPAAAAIIALGLLPGWNVHLVPESVRDRAVFRMPWRQIDVLTEYEYWKIAQREATADWARKGRDLARYVQAHPFDDPDPVCVVSPLGCIGWYSRLTLYDRAGLVTPQVSRSGHYRNPRRSPPGHDRVVPLSFFLEQEPEILKFSVVDNTDPQKVAFRCKGQERSLREARSPAPIAERYVIDFAKVPGDSAAADSAVVVAWRRIDGNAEAAWSGFAARMDSLQTEQSVRGTPPRRSR